MNDDGRRARWAALLATAPGEKLRGMALSRIVERRVLESRRPPDFLFTSGRPGRYNPAGVEGVYFSADDATAGAEFDRYWQGRATQRVLYFCRASARVLDRRTGRSSPPWGCGSRSCLPRGVWPPSRRRRSNSAP